MTREEIIAKIIELFKKKYDIDISSFSEDTEVNKFAELNDKLDSIEFMNFIFDVEDMLEVKNTDNSVPTKIGEIYDLFEKLVLEKESQ